MSLPIGEPRGGLFTLPTAEERVVLDARLPQVLARTIARHRETEHGLHMLRLNSQPHTQLQGGNVTSAGWQVTLCDPMWHVSSRSGVATLRSAIHLLLTYLHHSHTASSDGTTVKRT